MPPSRALSACLVLLGASLLVAGCRPSRTAYQPTYYGAAGPRPPHGAQQAQNWSWPTVNPPGAGISCQMPAIPHYEQRIGRENDGAFFRSISARTQVPFGTFAIVSTEWEGGIVGDPLEAAAEVADELFTEQQLTRRRSIRLDVPGFYGREDTGLAPNGVFVALRQFVGQSRIYVAVAIVSPQPGPLGTAEAFMASIRLDTADALLPVGGAAQAPAALFMPETDFAVRMPPLTSRPTDVVSLGDDTVVAHSFVADIPQARLRVRVIDLPEGADGDVVPRLFTSLSLGEPGAPVSASGFPGTSFARSSGNVSIQGRLFVTATRAYVLEAASPAAQANDVIRTFFDSFRIL